MTHTVQNKNGYSSIFENFEIWHLSFSDHPSAKTPSFNEDDEKEDEVTTLNRNHQQGSKDISKCANGSILGKGRPSSSPNEPRQRKRSHVVFEPLVTLQRPSLQSNSSEELNRQLDANEMVDHLVNTLGLIGVSPTSTRRHRPARTSLQHNNDFYVNEN